MLFVSYNTSLIIMNIENSCFCENADRFFSVLYRIEVQRNNKNDIINYHFDQFNASLLIKSIYFLKFIVRYNI